MQTMTSAAPERSLQQRRAALERANDIRTYRKQVKQDLKAGRKTFFEVLFSEDPRLETMKVVTVLLACPKYGRVKTHRLLADCRISPSKSLSGLTRRQRVEIMARVRRVPVHIVEAEVR
jgi:hypothetical protein